jgi:hypothetical protein
VNRLTAFLARWLAQPDKALHVIVGALIAMCLAPTLNDLTCIAIVGALGWGKERYDKAHADVHTPDGWDAFATVAGAVLGLFLWALVGLPVHA